MNVTFSCEICGKDLSDKRKGTRTCSPKCRVTLNRNEQKEFDAKPEAEQLSTLEKKLGFPIDRTRAFTEEEQNKVNKLPYQQRLTAMARPGGMDKAEEKKHYQQAWRWPKLEYVPAGEQSRRWGA